MTTRTLAEALRIPLFFTIAAWVIVFLIMVAIEAIWYLDRQF